MYTLIINGTSVLLYKHFYRVLQSSVVVFHFGSIFFRSLKNMRIFVVFLFVITTSLAVPVVIKTVETESGGNEPTVEVEEHEVTSETEIGIPSVETETTAEDEDALEIPAVVGTESEPAKEEKPAAAKPAAAKPAAAKPAAAKPAAAKPAAAKPAAAKPAAAKPAASKPAAAKPAAATPAAAKPAAAKPAAAKPAAAKPAAAKPAAAKPAAAKPADAKPADAKPAAAKPAAAKPAAAKPADAKPADAKPADAKPADAKPAAAKPAAAKPADAQPAAAKPAAAKPAAAKPEKKKSVEVIEGKKIVEQLKTSSKKLEEEHKKRTHKVNPVTVGCYSAVISNLITLGFIILVAVVW